MFSRLFTRAALLALSLLCTLYQPLALADKPAWSSIAELLVGGMSESDPLRMSSVMRRCTALNMTLAGMVSDSNPEMSSHYEQEALRLIQNGVLIDSRLERETTGLEADIPALSSLAMANVKEMLGGYNDWLDDNMASGGSYISKEFEMEMDGCSLASRLVNQLFKG